MNIALLECDANEAQLLEQALRSAGHTVKVFATEIALTRELTRVAFDLVIAGPTDQDASSREAIVVIRGPLKSLVPVICVLRKNIESDIVAALNAGADDCVVKPVRPLEFVARALAVTRRTAPSVVSADEHFEMGALSVDLRNRLIFREGERLTLTPKTYDLAVLLLTHTGQLLTRSYLLERVWGRGRSSQTRTLDTHISRLRSVLGLAPENGWKLQSVYQHGYRLDYAATARASGRAISAMQGASMEASCTA